MCRLNEIIKSICLSVFLMGLGISVANAATISFSSSASSVSIGNTFSVDIIGTSFPGNFDGGALNLSFNSSAIKVNSVSVNGGYWDYVADSGVTDNTAGTVTGIEFGRSDVGTGFTIATLNIEALAAGFSDLFLEVSNNASIFTTFSAGNAEYTGALNLINGSVTVSGVSPVPVPAAVWLFGSGLIGLLGFMKRK